MILFFTERHQNDGDEEVQNHKSHKNNAGANQEGTKYRVIIQDLWSQKLDINVCADVLAA